MDLKASNGVQPYNLQNVPDSIEFKIDTWWY